MPSRITVILNGTAEWLIYENADAVEEGDDLVVTSGSALLARLRLREVTRWYREKNPSDPRG